MPTLLVVIPHPDDEGYALGGLIALARDAGWPVEVVCASRGERGKRHDAVDAGPESLGEARLLELEAACGILGARFAGCWNLPDGRLRECEATGLVAQAISTLQPDVVATLGADGAYGHPDHIAVHRWVMAAAAAGAGPGVLLAAFSKGLFLPQYEKCREMMGEPPDPPPDAIGSDTWDFELDIASARHRKLAAIACHRTQLPGDDPRALFPPGIVDALLELERFTVAGGAASTRRLMAAIGAVPAKRP